MRFLHIFAGLSALISGVVALYVLKGGKIHRKSGMMFVLAMLIMSASGTIMATLKFNRASIMGGLLTFYLVVTGLLAVRKSVQGLHWLNIFAALFGIMVGFLGINFGAEGLNIPKEQFGGNPMTCFIFGGVALLSVVADLRMMFSQKVQGISRLVRHLWRMCFAMLLAVASFFLGQAHLFPTQLQRFPLLVTPVLLVFLIMIYWLIRIGFMKISVPNKESI